MELSVHQGEAVIVEAVEGRETVENAKQVLQE